MERVYEAPIIAVVGGNHQGARAMTYEEACNTARQLLCSLDAAWCTASCQEIASHIAQDCTLFTVGWEELRIALTGTAQCPAPAPGAGANTLLLLGLAGLVVVGGLALVMTTRGKKKVLIARIT